MKYVCKVCGYVYDPADNNGVEFDALPDDWTCPLCGVVNITADFADVFHFNQPFISISLRQA